jgi:hypothetical protein
MPLKCTETWLVGVGDAPVPSVTITYFNTQAVVFPL